jgi:hypothetical protein
MGLDTVELVMAFEEKFGVQIPDAVTAELVTPRDVTDYLMAAGASGARSRDDVARLVREIVEEQTGTRDFTEDSRFVEDLHLD